MTVHTPPPRSSQRVYCRTCGECGAPYRTTADTSSFCEAACRTAFNNRRRTRGAELYDLFMAIRYDRADATSAGAWRAMCRMAAAYRDEDKARRAGRKSWRAPLDVIRERAWLFANVIHSKTWAKAQAR